MDNDRFINLFLISLLTFIIIYFSLFSFAKVKGESMEPTYQNGDLLFIAKQFIDLNKKDVVVLKHQNKNLVKRIVAKNGDVVKIKNSNLYVNGKYIKENYIKNSNFENTKTFIVSENNVFVLGDNRNNSLDSRNFGGISKEKIIGKVIHSF